MVGKSRSSATRYVANQESCWAQTPTAIPPKSDDKTSSCRSDAQSCSCVKPNLSSCCRFRIYFTKKVYEACCNARAAPRGTVVAYMLSTTPGSPRIWSQMTRPTWGTFISANFADPVLPAPRGVAVGVKAQHDPWLATCPVTDHPTDAGDNPART